MTGGLGSVLLWHTLGFQYVFVLVVAVVLGRFSDRLGLVNLLRNFLLRSPYLLNVVYLLLSIYVAAHSAAGPLKRKIMYLICCPSDALCCVGYLVVNLLQKYFCF